MKIADIITIDRWFLRKIMITAAPMIPGKYHKWPYPKIIVRVILAHPMKEEHSDGLSQKYE